MIPDHAIELAFMRLQHLLLQRQISESNRKARVAEEVEIIQSLLHQLPEQDR